MGADATTLRDPPGITTWENSRNGFAICRLHYTADPRKCDPHWKLSAKQGIPDREWRREYEIDWTAPEGEPVIPEHDPQIHERSLTPHPQRRLLRFWDPGTVSPAVLFAQLTPWGQLQILAELAPFNTPLDQLIPMVWAMTAELVPHRNVFDAGDPASTSVKETGSSVLGILQRSGIILRTNRPGTDESYRSLRRRFMERVFVPGLGHEPAIVIDPQKCTTLVAALRGAFHLNPNPPYKPHDEHPYKDIVDALRYGNDNLAFENQEFQRQIRDMAVNDRQW